MLTYTDQWGTTHVFVASDDDNRIVMERGRVIFDNDQYREAMIPAIRSEVEEPNIGEITTRYLMNITHGQFTRQQLVEEDYIDDAGDLQFRNILYYHGHIDELIPIARSQLSHLKIMANEVSGDDDYFDYFPAAVNEVLQLCQALNMRDEYRSTWRHLVDFHYQSLEPWTLPTWDLNDLNEARALGGQPPLPPEIDQLKEAIQSIYDYLNGDAESGPLHPTESDIHELRELSRRISELEGRSDQSS